MTFAQFLIELMWHPLTQTAIMAGAVLLAGRKVAQALTEPQVYNVTNVLPIDKETEQTIAKVVSLDDHRTAND